MKYQIALITGLLTASCLIFVYYLYPAPATVLEHSNTAYESAHVRQIVADLGNVPPKSRTTRIITIDNDSASSWTLAELRSDCGCIVNNLEPKRIAPGASGALSIQYVAPDSAGSLNRNIMIAFLETTAPLIHCRVTGFVEPWCFSIPPDIDFGSVLPHKDGKLPSRSITIFVRHDSHIDWNRSPRVPDWLSVTTTAHNPTAKQGPGKNSTFTIAVTPRLTNHPGSANLSGVIGFESRDSMESVNVPVSLFVEPLLSATPECLFLGAHNVGEQFVCSLTVSLRTAPTPITPLFIQDRVRITHDLGPLLAVDVVPGTECGELLLGCSFKMPDANGLLDGTIEVSCDEHTVVVPVIGKVEHPK